ncbi:MAG: alkaline phosphatase, partial [Cyanobacteria bacterium 13_1_40CM_2_61_4]
SCHQAATARLLLRRRYDAILALGDVQYGGATLSLFRRWYGSSWGQPRLKTITHPAPGNHEYEDASARGYFAYFGAAAGEPGKGWYSFDLGAWHLVSLNSNCDHVGGCGLDSPQERWLRADLAKSPARCTIAYWHHPRFSSGLHGDDYRTAVLWDDLATVGAELVLVGHDHDYERFAPRQGIREIVAGTGGKSLYPLRPGPLRRRGSQIAQSTSYGILELTLGDNGYAWRFIATDGRILDRGHARCHA